MLGLVLSSLYMAVYFVMLLFCGGILIAWVYLSGYELLHKKEFDQMLKEAGLDENWGKLQ
jgi:hypothetical protein